MRVLNRRITLIVLGLLLGLMMGCSGDDVNGGESSSALDVEGQYEGTMKMIQIQMVENEDDDGNVIMSNPEEDGSENPFLNSEAEATFAVSLDGDRMALGEGLEGKYDAKKNLFVATIPFEPGYKDVVLTLRFYEEDGVVKASGEDVREHIETGWKNIISYELIKISE